MKSNGTLLPVNGKANHPYESYEYENDQPTSNFYDTPIRKDAFAMADDEKIRIITNHFKEIMHVLGLDLDDDSLKDTPGRVAKMFVKESFSGLDPSNRPVVALFDNKYRYNQMLLEKNIRFQSSCEHHFVPFHGKAHVAYIPSGKVIGLSKLSRIVQYYSQRPQVQERLTIQVANELKSILQTEDVAVLIDAAHLCVTSRGVKDADSNTVTTYFSGKFNREETRNEFLALIK